MPSSSYPRSVESARAIAIVIAAYAISLVVLGLTDAVSLVARVGGTIHLSVLELGLLPTVGLCLAPRVHVALLGCGLLYVALWARVSRSWTRARPVLLGLPLAALASAAAIAARKLPLVARTPLLQSAAWVAAVAAPLALLGAALYLARQHRPRRWHERALLSVLALGLTIATHVLGLTEAVMARLPGTLFALVALTYLLGYLLRNTRRPALLAGGLTAAIALASSYAAALPSARSKRTEAVVAHQTLLLQALLFIDIALFARAPSLPACTTREQPLPAASAPTSHDVLVITLDALRADHLAAYGYDLVTMPNVEALLRESVTFDTAYSAAPGTSGSFTAMWTGSSAYSMRALRRWPPTLHQRMRALGYRILGSDLSPIASHAAPGFPKAPLYDAPIRFPTKAAQLVDTLIEQLTRTKAPFLAFAHFNESHDAVARRYVPEVFRARSQSRYDDALFEVDRHLGRLLDALRASGRYDNTVIVFGADHGEFFGEHARERHGSLLYEPVVRIPFAIKRPGVMPRREATFVSGFDLSPTVFKAATGRPWPLPTLGQDVLAEIASGHTERTLFMENVSEHAVRRLVAVRKGPFKYTLLRGTGVEELFDLSRDPGELDNLAGEAPDTLESMRRELEATLERQACELRSMRAQP